MVNSLDGNYIDYTETTADRRGGSVGLALKGQAMQNWVMSASEEPRRRSMRIPGYDYSTPGSYFVSVVVEKRRSLFGEVIDGEMRSNAAGQMVLGVWESLPGRFTSLDVGDSIVMPDHFHGIIILRGTVGAGLVPAHSSDKDLTRAATRAAPTDPTLGDVVGSFKSLVTREYMRGVRESGWAPFRIRLWQRGYYDHVIRDQADWDRLHRYILANPMNWAQDEENLTRE